MDMFLLRLYQTEVLFQCECVIAAAHEINKFLAPGETMATWRALQNLLVAAANLSKLFWGSRGRREREREALRKSVGVANDSPLRSPDLRNNFEHIDERLSDWYATSPNHVYVGRTIGPPQMIVGDNVAERFQHFDPETAKVTFWEHELDLNEIVAEAIRIRPLAKSIVAKPWWDHPPPAV